MCLSQELKLTLLLDESASLIRAIMSASVISLNKLPSSIKLAILSEINKQLLNAGNKRG